MAAVPIYVWNGSAWQETGPTIPANPIKYQASAPSSPSTGDIWVDSDGDVTTGSQQFQRFRFVASGGETTISGADANGAVLAYTAGLEQVVLNGAVLVRGHDYTATTGTTITGLSPALVASDVLEVFSFIAFTVANTYTQAQVYTKAEVDSRTIVKQVVNATYGTQTNSTSTTNIDTGLSVTITPTSASSKMLVFVNQNGIRTSTNNNVGQFFLRRGSTDLVMFEVSAAEVTSAIGVEIGGSGASYLDSPATTSAVTYKTVFNRRAGTGTLSCQYDGAVSTITVMEVLI